MPSNYSYPALLVNYGKYNERNINIIKLRFEGRQDCSKEWLLL